MLFRQLYDSTSSTFTYLLACERTKEAVLIDPVLEQQARDLALLHELGLSLKFTLETHVHADHVTGAGILRKRTGCRIVLSNRAGAQGLDLGVDDGDVVRFGDLSLRVIATPGHTNGCVTYVTAENTLAFTGDALLIRAAGRTDFQQGSARTLYRSITHELFSLPDTCLVYPGHDYAGRTVTTIGEEKAHNPRVGGQANEGDFVGYMENLNLPHPKKMDVAVPANLLCGQPEAESLPAHATWAPLTITLAGIAEVTPEWTAENRAATHLLDVREPQELQADGRLPSALHIPLGQLRDRLAEVPTDRPVVVFCRSGRRSAQATNILRQGGRSDVASLTGGILGWTAAGLPVER